jgi:hypothetical protein
MHLKPADLMQAAIARDDARLLHKGAIALTTKDVIDIAIALQLEPEELCRPLTDDERSAWRFYRLSARNVADVWHRVAEASTAYGLSQRKLGELLGLSQSTISRALRGEKKSPVLNWHGAAAIADALGLEEGPEVFVYPYFIRENEPNRG